MRRHINIDPYPSYYKNQAGGDGGNLAHYQGAEYQKGYGLKTINRNSPYQQGNGIGSFLGGLFREALPYIKRGAATVGKEMLSPGMNILDDVVMNQDGLKQSATKRGSEILDNLAEKAKKKVFSVLRGEGYKMKNKNSKRQLCSKVGKRKTKKRKTKPSKKGKRKTKKSSFNKQDIFSRL